MIFLHLILGLILGKLYNHTLLFVVASMLPDIDHLYVIIKNKLYNKKKLFDALKHEERYNLRFKTPLMHSVLGLIICTSLFYLFSYNLTLSVYFSLAYFSHLLLDWPDIDKKQYLYPFKKEFKGFLPIWSRAEKIATLVSLFVLMYFYI